MFASATTLSFTPISPNHKEVGLQSRTNNKIQSSVLIFAFGLAAEIERELISQRTKVKSKLDGKEAAIKELLEKNIPVASIAKIFGVARTTMVNFIGSRGVK